MRGLAVLASVSLDDQAGIEAREVGDIRADGHLPSKLEAESLPAAKHAPEALFSLGRVKAKLFCE